MVIKLTSKLPTWFHNIFCGCSNVAIAIIIATLTDMLIAIIFLNPVTCTLLKSIGMPLLKRFLTN